MTADEWVGWVGAVLCVAWLIAPRLRAYDRRKEAARRERDAAKWQRHLDRIVREESDAIWAGIERAVGMDPDLRERGAA